MENNQLSEDSPKEINNPSKNESNSGGAAEAFKRLESVVWKVHEEVIGIRDQFQDGNYGSGDEKPQLILEGKLSLLESVFNIHDHLFKRVVAMEAGEWAPDPFIIDLTKHIENELERHGILIVRPEPGAKLDLKYMHTQKDIATNFWRKPNTVAKVHSCGFVAKVGNEEKVLKMAVVDIYRSKKDSTEER